ncbi:hypothetical protein [Robbsia andropogonis]|uniref:hypothetical protein n=1 Tax=Robbsia andropogonis TaxID=28092 RepID=UPI0004B86541|nr:hypothetical protein [Robbsia andropogonis]
MIIQDPTDKIRALEEVLGVLIRSLPVDNQAIVGEFLDVKIRHHAEQIQEIPAMHIRLLGPNEVSPVISNRHHQRQLALFTEIRDSIFPQNSSRA